VPREEEQEEEEERTNERENAVLVEWKEEVGVL